MARQHRSDRQRAETFSPSSSHAADTPSVLMTPGRPGQPRLGAGGTPDAPGTELDVSHQKVSTSLIKAELDQSLPEPRRVEHRRRTFYEMLAAMGSPSPAGDEGPAKSAASDGLSAFTARVLDQLALSAWLPAAFLTASLAIMLEFRNSRSANIIDAVGKLTAHPVQVLVILIPVLVIATVVTQAFSFEAIRTLEGYWRARGPLGSFGKLRIQRHVQRKKAIENRRRSQSAEAFRAALPKIFLDSDDLTGPIARAIETQLSDRNSSAPDLQGKDLQIFVKTIQSWRDQADSWRLAKIDRLIAEQNSYPVESRVLPTKLGNLIRATEDQLQHAGGDVQSFVLRQRDTVSHRIQMQHDQFRTRLDMYCTLVFVSAFLAAITFIILVGRVGVVSICVTSGGFALMAAASYLAAISSASGYCTALRQMDQAITIEGGR
jgi:hypothetical protein